MNCREIWPKWSQTTASAATQTRTPRTQRCSAPCTGSVEVVTETCLTVLVWLAGNCGSWHFRECVSALLADLWLSTGGKFSKGTALRRWLPKAYLRQAQDHSGLLWSRNIFSDLFGVSLNEGLSLLPTENEAGRNRRTGMQLLCKEKKVPMVMEENWWQFEALDVEWAEKLKRQ